MQIANRNICMLYGKAECMFLLGLTAPAKMQISAINMDFIES